MALEDIRVPRSERSGAEEHAAAKFEDFVQSEDLRVRWGRLGRIKPVHRVHELSGGVRR